MLLGFFAGRAARLDCVFFFELRAATRGVDFLLDFFAAFFAAVFFVVTFFRESFCLALDLPALAVFFLLVFFFAAFLVVFFAPFFCVLPFFFAEIFFLEDFFAVFFAFRAEGRRAAFLLAVFFEGFLLAAAFLVGMRYIPRWLKTQPAIIHRWPAT